MTSSILRIILTTWVASCNCPFFDNNVSKTLCYFMLVTPFPIQSTPWNGSFFSVWSDLAVDRDLRAFIPAFSARAIGICYKASANALMAYCSVESILSAYLWTAKLAAISADPPPYTILLHLIKVETTQRASWIDLWAYWTIIFEPPLTKMVTALELAHSSITSIF